MVAVQIDSEFWSSKTRQANATMVVVQEFLNEFLGQHGDVKKAFTVPAQVPVDKVSQKGVSNVKVLLYLADCLDSGYYPRLKKELRRRLRQLQGVNPLISIVNKSPW